jgi:AhpD family alkylhydroperoxidase
MHARGRTIVSVRLEYWRTAPDEFKALMSLQLRLKAAMESRLFDLVYLRVSQINGCPFCVDLHATELRKDGESERRIAALVVWRDTPFFSAPERAALEWAERLTDIRHAGDLSSSYDALRPHFSDRQVAVLTFAISVMNSINRIAIGFGRKPQSDSAETPAAKPEPQQQLGR